MIDNGSELFNQSNSQRNSFLEKQTNFFPSFMESYNNIDESLETQKIILDDMNTCSNEQNHEKNMIIRPREVKFIIVKNNLGRKRKFSSEIGVHTKYDKDNIIRKIKTTMIKHLITFINQLIFQIYSGKIGYGPLQKKFFTINQNQIINSRNDKNFIYKTLKDILSEDITGRISNLVPEHNKNLIEILLNEEDDEKKEKFEKFFSLKFIDCIKHFCEQENLEILNGLEVLKKTCENMKENEDEDYIKTFTLYANDFENYIKSKKNRKSKKDN